MSTVTAVFARWSGGWELTVEGHEDVSTQVATLSKARQQVRDYLDTIDPDTDHSAWTVHLSPADPGLQSRLAEARAATQNAATAQEHAAAQSRALVRHLSSEGYRGADIAAILGVTPGRVSQLMASPAA